MTTVAWIGLGQMGLPMASRFLDAGHELVVWNRTAERSEPLVERGARQGGSPAEAASSAEVAITMVTDPDALEEVIFGDEGLAAGLRPGSTLVDMSTVGPATVRGVADRLPDGVAVVDAPVLGSVPQAEDGSLAVFVGASPEAFEKVRPLLEVLGSPRRLGPLGAGAAMKLVANSTLGTLMTGLGEALALADALDLPEDVVLDVLAESPIGITVRSKRSRIESEEYAPSFKLALAVKDVRLVAEAARSLGVPHEVASAALAHLEKAGTGGLGELDYSAVVAHLRGRPAKAPTG
jgi:3-hydroxyisobutyrate dehydrogenase-like beta-hydroxyacid dehydrogenase